MLSNAIALVKEKVSALDNIVNCNRKQPFSSEQSFRKLQDSTTLLGIVVSFVCLYWGHIFAPHKVNDQTIAFLERISGVYKETDFVNRKGNSVPYWDIALQEFPLNNTCQQNCKERTVTSILSIRSGSDLNYIGPCYLPSSFQNVQSPNIRTLHLSTHGNYSVDDKVNQCRPGFIIIGAGKCGTSSLYQYITGHPRVLPAKEKQIHYFKNATDRPMSWYLSHFPSAENFLSYGALMTGEASPGYLVSQLFIFI